MVREMLNNSPMALRCLKSAMNADCDGQAGIQELAGNATMLFYMSEEGQEGRNAYWKNANQILANLPASHETPAISRCFVFGQFDQKPFLLLLRL